MKPQSLYSPTVRKNRTSHVPGCLAIVVCDYIIRDAETGKLSLIGQFSYISASSFPTRHARMHIFVSLTDYQGEAEGRLRFVDSNGKTIAQTQGKLSFPDKLGTVDINFVINGMVFPKPGTYIIEFLVNNNIIGQRKIQVIQKEAK